MKLPDYAKWVIENFRLGYVATVTQDGRPSLSPKGTFVVLDDNTIAFGEIRSPQTLANLAHLPECEINFVDPFARKGVRVRAASSFVDRGTDEFENLIVRWIDIWGDLADRINVVVTLKVSKVGLLTTPPYDDGATEEELIALYRQKYAEIYP